jgi:hypothetical protein
VASRDELREKAQQSSNGGMWIGGKDGEPNELFGTIVAVGETTDKNGVAVPVLEIEIEDDLGETSTVTVGAYRTVLRRQLTEANPNVGDTIYIEFVGEAKSKTGQKFFDYKSAVASG